MPDSLFRTLRPELRASAPLRGADGYEAYLTQVLGVVLREDPGLVRWLLQAWCGEVLDSSAPLEVRTEVSYPAPARVQQGQAIPDIVIESSDVLVFIEDKVGARLNRYSLIEGGDIDQVELYHEVLQAQRGERRGHLLVLCTVSQPRHAELAHYRGDRSWWALYRLIEGWRAQEAHPGGHAAWLEDQLLLFFREVQLDPPSALQPGSAFNEHHARRLLADAARLAVGLENPRLATGLLYEREKSTWSVWFQGGQLCIFKSGQGSYQPPELQEVFWGQDVEAQIRFLADLLPRVETLSPGDSARMPLELAIEQFDPPYRATIEAAVRLLTGRWSCEPSVGKMSGATVEISLRHSQRKEWCIRLSPYRPNRLTLAGHVDVQAARAAVAVTLGGDLPDPQPTQQVNVPLTLLRPELIEALIHDYERSTP